MSRMLVILGVALAVVAAGAFAAGSSEEQSEASEVAWNREGLPVVDGGYSLTAFAIKHNVMPNWSDSEAMKVLQERTNITVEWDHVPPQNATEKLNLIFAAGDMPDMIIANALGRNDYRYGSQGLLIPLEDYVEALAPNVMEMYREFPETRSWSTTPDGHIYSLPNFHPRAGREAAVGWGLVINTTWLDVLGLEKPNTRDEFVEVLRAFKNQDPNGNGVADEIPLSMTDTEDRGHSWEKLFHAFGLEDGSRHLHVTPDNELVLAPRRPEYREAVRWIHSLYAEGLLDEETFVQDGTQLKAKGRNPDVPLVGVFVAWHRSEVVGNDRALEHYDNLLPLQQSNGERFWPLNNATPGFSTGRFAITADADVPEIAVRWIDAAFEPELNFWIMRGMEGQTWEWKDGMRVKFSPPEGMGEGEFFLRTGPVWFFPAYYRPEIFDTVVQNTNVNLKQEQAEMYEPFLNDRTYPANTYVTSDVEKVIAELAPDIINFIEQSRAGWVINGTVDEEWDSFQNQLDRMGADELLVAYRTIFDDFYSR